ncbi:MAG: hypothetical protein ACLFWL_15430 [Candidatus Brocadiia bacterium]
MWNWLAIILLIVGAVAAVVKGMNEDRPWGAPVLGACIVGIILGLISPTVLYYYILIALLVGALVGYVKGHQKKKEWGAPLIAACTIAIIVMVLGNQVVPEKAAARKEVKQAHRKQILYDQAKMQYIGEYIEKNYPDHKVLLLMHYAGRDFAKKRQSAMISALKKGFGDDVTLEAQEHMPVPEGDPDDPMMMMEEPILTREKFDQITKPHPECDFIISIIGLPYEYEKTAIWQMPPEKRPKIFVASSLREDLLEKAMKDGPVVGAVDTKRDFRFNPQASVPADYKEAFEQRWKIVDKENLSELNP